MASTRGTKRLCSNESSPQKKGRLEGWSFELTPDEHKELVKSSEIFNDSVVRIYTMTRNDGVVRTSTGFLVYHTKARSLFLTCEHNFEEPKTDEVLQKGDEEVHKIRFLHNNGTKDLNIERIIMRDKERDLLLFSVKNFPSHRCLELSTTETIRQWDKVCIVGYIAPTLHIDGEDMELVMVKKPSAFPGKIICDPYIHRNSAHYKDKIWNSCKATKGVSGSPLLKTDKVVGVHLATDKDWREATSAITVFNWIRGVLKLEDDNSDTIYKLLEKVYSQNFKK